MKKKILLILCMLIFSISTFAISSNTKSKTSSFLSVRSGQAEAIPEAIIYSTLFHYVQDIKAYAEEVASEGKDAGSLNHYFSDAAKLSDQQALALNTIAYEVVLEVDQQDRKALEVIDRFRSQFPKGKIPKGAKPPPPPPELQVMQQEKNNILLKGRDRLREALGEDGINNLNVFIKEHITPKITATGIK